MSSPTTFKLRLSQELPIQEITPSQEEQTGKLRKKPGRPKGHVKPNEQRKIKVLRIYCIEAKKKIITDYCHENSISVSSFLGSYIDKAVRDIKKR